MSRDYDDFQFEKHSQHEFTICQSLMLNVGYAAGQIWNDGPNNMQNSPLEGAARYTHVQHIILIIKHQLIGLINI